MKKKYMALLLAAAMTVTSLNATAMAVNAADFGSEEETSVELNEEMPEASSDETDVQTGHDEETDSAEISFDEPESADENAQVEIQEDGDEEADLDFEEAGELSDDHDGSEIAVQDEQTKKAVQSIWIEKGTARTDYYAEIEGVGFGGSILKVTYADGSESDLKSVGKQYLYDEYGNEFKIECTDGEKVYKFEENRSSALPAGTYTVTIEGYENITSGYELNVRELTKESAPQISIGENEIERGQLYWFQPETTGVYIMDGINSAAMWEKVDGKYISVWNNRDREDIRYNLKKGSFYIWTVMGSGDRQLDLTITMEKQITGIHFTPDQFCGVSPCNKWNWCELRISGTLTLTYEDGTTETINGRDLGAPISAGGHKIEVSVKDENGKELWERYLNIVEKKYLGTKFTITFSYGDVKTDTLTIPVLSIDPNLYPEVKTGTTSIVPEPEDANYGESYACVRFVPTETAVYTTSWNSVYQLEDRKPTYLRRGVKEWSGAEDGYFLEKGKTYFIVGDVTEPVQVSRVTLSGCSWKTVSDTATSLKAGQKLQTCSTHKGETRTIVSSKLSPKLTLNVPVKKKVPLKVKQKFTVKATGLAKGDKVVSWTSSNTKVATVGAKGKITGKKVGTAKITVKLASGYTTWFTVKVQKKDVKTTSVKVINKATGKKTAKKITLKRGEKLNLQAAKVPVTSKEKLTYISSNKKAATVSAKGTIAAKKKGTATITVRSGSKSVKIRVTVK